MSDERVHVFLPLIDPPHMLVAFPVAKALASSLGVPLHILAPQEQPSSYPDLARQLQVSPEELDGVVIDQVMNLAEATISEAMSRRLSMVVLAVRLGTEAAEGPTEALAWHLLQKMPRAILIVPPGQDTKHWRLRKTLLPQDGTPGSAEALADVVNRSQGIEQLILRVAGAQVSQPKERGSLAMPRYVDQAQYEWASWGEEVLNRVARLAGNLEKSHLRLMVANGEPGAEIVRVATEEAVDMIVLPWHGHLEPGRGNIVNAVLQNAPCPVLLLPQGIGHDSNTKGRTQ